MVCSEVEVEHSVIIPVYNEEGNIIELHERLKKVLDSLTDSYEIIFVDDGSSDKGWQLIEELHEKDSRVKGISFSRNFGHHIAVTAGLDCCKGNDAVLMDGDLQDPPEEIMKLYQKFKQGYDIVYAIRKTRRDSAIKKVTSKLFYHLFKILCEVKICPNAGIFRIVSRRVVDSLKDCQERSRFIVALISWTGFSQVGIETERHARSAGKTKYNIFRLVKLAMDGFISFFYFPLRVAIYIGLVVSFVSFSIGLYMIMKKLSLGIPVLGYASIIVSVFFIGGIQLFIAGIMGEYIGRIFTEVQSRPVYIIKEKLGMG